MRHQAVILDLPLASAVTLDSGPLRKASVKLQFFLSPACFIHSL